MFAVTPIYCRVSPQVLGDDTYGKTADLEAKYNVSDKVARLPGYGEQRSNVQVDISGYYPDRNRKFVEFVNRVQLVLRRSKVNELAACMIAAH